MCPKFEISKSEKILFRKTVANVKPLTHTKSITPPQLPRSSRLSKTNTLSLSDDIDLPLVTGEEYIEFAHPGLQKKVLRKLKSGQYNIEAILDLHGHTMIEAKQALSEFLSACQQQHIQYALIIHGKGRLTQQPILKNQLNHWLRQIKFVLAFCSAQPHHGHRGALYLLLKSQKGYSPW